MYEQLLENAYDLHVHTAPDVVERKLDDFEYAERLLKLGMKGFAIKSHYFCTAERAWHVNKLYPGIRAMGCITLNNSVGGINPLAVETAARDGAKLVWMPTFNADNEVQYLFNKAGYEVLPPWAQVELERKRQGKPLTSIAILQDGKLKPAVYEVLKLVKEYDLILATGHLGKEEIYALAAAAKEMKMTKLVVTHPTFSSIALSKEEQKELADMGAYMEQCFGVISPKYGMTWDELYGIIRYVGPEKTILSSDLGQVNNPYPDEGLLEFVTRLAEQGFSRDEIRRMTAENTSYLVEG